MKKDMYTNPEVEVINFSAQDVITTSGETCSYVEICATWDWDCTCNNKGTDEGVQLIPMP